MVLAIGLHQGRSTRVPGSDRAESAINLLRRITAGEAIPVPEEVAIIGGGNVAMDIARSMARLQKQKYGKVGVTVTALEDFDHFLADKEEIEEAEEEGCVIYEHAGPRRSSSHPARSRASAPGSASRSLTPMAASRPNTTRPTRWCIPPRW